MLPLAADNLFMHVALLNALDLRLRGAEIVVAGAGERADALAEAALKLPFLDRIVVRAPSEDALPPTHPGGGEARGRQRAGGVHLRGRDLLAAGDGAGANCRNHDVDAHIVRKLTRARAVPGYSLQRFKTSAARLQLCARARAATLSRALSRETGCG